MSFFRKAFFGAAASGVVGSIFMVESILRKKKKEDKVLKGDKVVEGIKDRPMAKDMKLRHVQIFFRHGIRTPVKNLELPALGVAVYDKDIFMKDIEYTTFNHIVVDSQTQKPLEKSALDKHYEKTVLPGGIHLGQLTTNGQVQTYSLGRKLRREYMDELDFLPNTFNPKDVYVRTTNVKRNIASLRCVLSGMYSNSRMGRKEPVVFNSSEIEDEWLFPNTRACKVLRELNHNAMFHAVDNEELKPHRLHIEECVGIDSSKKKTTFIDVRDNLVCRESHGLGLTETTWYMWDIIQKYATRVMLYAVCGQHEAQRPLGFRLSTGRLFRNVWDNIEGHVLKNDSSPKFHLYATHDSTLVAMLAALDIFDDKWPEFAADLRFEVYEDNAKNIYVRTVYMGKGVILSGCVSDLCPIQHFKKILNPILIDDQEYKEICSSNILDIIAKEMMEQEIGEVETEEVKEESDKVAGL